MNKKHSVIEAINTRHSCRSFLPKKVPRSIIDQILKLAQKAPSSCNLQLTEVIVVNDPELLKKLSSNITRKFSWATTFLVLIYDRRFTIKHHAAVISLGAIMENILLAAPEFGLSTCPMAGFENDANLKKILHIPENYEVSLIVALGYAQKPKTDWLHVSLDKFRHYNSWQNKSQVLKDSLQLDKLSINDLVSYRERIAPAYLYHDHHRLQSFEKTIYETAAQNPNFCELLSPQIELLDLISYDGAFISRIIKDKPKVSISISDFVPYVLGILHKAHPKTRIFTLPHINDEFDVITCVHKIEFTPNFEAFLTASTKFLKTGGYFYITTSIEPFMLNLKRHLLAINIYENNPFYKIGPYRTRPPHEVDKTMYRSSLLKINSGYVTTTNPKYYWGIFKKA